MVYPTWHSRPLEKKAEISIQGCLVIINDSVVLDSSRILASGDTILVSLADSTNSSAGPKLEFLHRKAPILVVFKPAGMRTKGQFPNTLESTISEQEGSMYYNLSPLDTSCAGLCDSIQTGHEKDPPSIIHSMTALVYGTVPDGWRPCRNVTINV
jgi:23S rRNA-/tRNA-specific pseudouridylate synthase